MTSLLIRGGTVVNADRAFQADVLTQDGKIVAVVQPHRYTRLQSLFEEFCTCFNDADAVVVAEVIEVQGCVGRIGFHDAITSSVSSRRARPRPSSGARPPTPRGARRRP